MHDQQSVAGRPCLCVTVWDSGLVSGSLSAQHCPLRSSSLDLICLRHTRLPRRHGNDTLSRATATRQSTEERDAPYWPSLSIHTLQIIWGGNSFLTITSVKMRLNKSRYFGHKKFTNQNTFLPYTPCLYKSSSAN